MMFLKVPVRSLVAVVGSVARRDVILGSSRVLRRLRHQTLVSLLEEVHRSVEDMVGGVRVDAAA